MSEYGKSGGEGAGKPLAGRRIIVTRSLSRLDELAALLKEAGAEMLPLPTIRIAPPDDAAPLAEAVDNAEKYDWIFFTSSNAVDAFMNRFVAARHEESLNSILRVAAVGAATAEALAEYSVHVDFQPQIFTGEALATSFAESGEIRGKKILLPRSDIAPPAIIEILHSYGAGTKEVTAYRTVPETKHGEEYNRLFAEESADMITFTSSSTVHNLMALLTPPAAVFLREKLPSASIGPVTSKTLGEYGITPAVEPKEHTAKGMIEAIIAYYKAREG